MTEKVHRLSLAECDRHYKAVRQAMKEKGLDALLVWADVGGDYNGAANLHYLSQVGGGGEDAFLIFPLEEEPYLIVGHAGVYQIKCWHDYGSWIHDIHGKEEGTYAKTVVKALSQMKLTKAKLGIPGLVGESGNMFPWTIYMDLKAQLPGADLVDASGVIETVRAIKSPEELALMERSNEIAEAAIDTLVEVARPGVPEHEVIADMFHTMVTEGAELPTLFLWDSGVVLSGGGRLGWTKHRILQPGDVIFQEFSPKVHGYSCHLNQTSLLGDWPKGLDKAYAAWHAAYRAGYSALRPGLAVDDLRKILRESIESAGFRFAIGFHGTGYGNEGFGLPPEPEAPVTFREGMCVAFEPNATLPDGTGVRIGDTVVVTKDGARRLGKKEPDIKVIT